MFSRPNVDKEKGSALVKNDLYRKFRDYFVGATEKGFEQQDPYGVESYISVNPAEEESIKDALGNKVNCILPITGATGIGKTHLLLYCLKSYYETKEIPTNTPAIFEKNGQYDLVYYSDFTITEPTVLQDPARLFLAKIKAMCEEVLNFFKPSDSVDIDAYIEKNKLEVKYYSLSNKKFERELFLLSNLLSLPQVKIKNVIFIFDDLESLHETQQFYLLKNFLVFFENLKSKAKKRFRTKFFFALRDKTYANVYKEDFYNTHRANKALSVVNAPTLSQLFDRRFDVIIKNGTARKAKNIEEWKRARQILTDISDRVDRSYNNLLLDLCNKNVGNSLDNFLDILSNRRWTQKNVNPAASFRIAEEDYYINDMNILRILSMGESKVFFPNFTVPIRCIFSRPGESLQEDLISLLILRAYRNKTYTDRDVDPTSSLVLSVSDIIDWMAELIIPAMDDYSYIREKEKLSALVNSFILYYEENRFIHKDVRPKSESEKETRVNEYFMLPRGKRIFDMFFERSILFTIFRDSFLMDDTKFDLRCSSEMEFADLLNESLKYGKELITVETALFRRISQNAAWSKYISFCGQWSVSERFLKGIKTSVQIFYREGNPPAEMLELINGMTEQIALLIQTIGTGNEEVAWF